MSIRRLVPELVPDRTKKTPRQGGGGGGGHFSIVKKCRTGLLFFVFDTKLDKPALLGIRLLFGFDKLNQSTNTETAMLSRPSHLILKHVDFATSKEINSVLGPQI